MLSTLKFEIASDKYITAYNATENLTKVNIKSLSDYLDAKLDDKEYFHWLDNGCTRVDVFIKGESISSTADQVQWMEGDLYIKFGDFSFTTGSYQYIIIGYFDGITNPMVITDEGRVNFKTL